MPKKPKKRVVNLTGNLFEKFGQYSNEVGTVPDVSKHLKSETSVSYEYITSPESRTDVHRVYSSKYKVKGPNLELNEEPEAPKDYVFKMNFAGSGINQWPKLYKGFSGYNQLMEIVPDEQIDPAERKEAENLYGQLQLDVFKKYTATDRIYEGEEISGKELNDILTKEYGRFMYLGDGGVLYDSDPNSKYSPISGIRKKMSADKRRGTLNLSGPLGSLMGGDDGGGERNIGKYSIENLKSYAEQEARKWLDSIPEDSNDPIIFSMKGHSRGGCACNEAATIINKLVQEKYPKLKNRVKFEVQLYDPVPGIGSYANHALVDHNAKNIQLLNGKTGQGLNSVPENKNDSIVYYGIYSNHSHAFDPQTVVGANKVILTGMSHNMGLFDIDSQKHKRGYVLGSTGDKYRGTGVHDLADGLYVLDEHDVLFEIKNMQEATNFLDSVYATRKGQAARKETMYNVVKEYFARHPEKDILTEKDSRYAPQKAFDNAISELSKMAEGLKNNQIPFSKVKEQLNKVIAYRELVVRCSADKDRTSKKAFKNYRSLAESADYPKKYAEIPHVKAFVDNLTLSDIIKFAQDPVTALKNARVNTKLSQDNKNYNEIKLALNEVELKTSNKFFLDDHIMDDGAPDINIPEDKQGVVLNGGNGEDLNALVFAELASKGHSIDDILDNTKLAAIKESALETLKYKMGNMTAEAFKKDLAKTNFAAQQACLDYIDEKVSEMGGFSVNKLAKPENRGILVANKFMKNLSSRLMVNELFETIASDNSIGQERYMELYDKQFGTSKLIDAAMDTLETGIKLIDGDPNLAPQKLTEKTISSLMTGKLASDLVNAELKRGKSFSESVKMTSNLQEGFLMGQHVKVDKQKFMNMLGVEKNRKSIGEAIINGDNKKIAKAIKQAAIKKEEPVLAERKLQ